MPVNTSCVGISLLLFATATRVVAAIALLTGFALAADPSCELVADATAKNFTIPTHIYSTETASYTGGRPRNSETIYLNDKAYVQVNGRWRVSPMSPKAMLEQLREARKEAKPDSRDISTCRFVRDEVINGEAASLYSEHTENEVGKSDSRAWISKSRGLVLKLEQDMDLGGAAGKSHRVSRYEYTNVQAPAGVR